MSAPFELHEQLATDTYWVSELELCRCLLSRDARFPWLILVPRIQALTEFHQVPQDKQQALLSDIHRASVALEEIVQPDKLNVAALGNQVSQLHIHVIARRHSDVAWPGPVWGVGEADSYTDKAAETRLNDLRRALAD